MLDLRLHVDGVGETRVEQIDEFGLGIVGQADTAGEANKRLCFSRHDFSMTERDAMYCGATGLWQRGSAGVYGTGMMTGLIP
jgi:hypothetical protein